MPEEQHHVGVERGDCSLRGDKAIHAHIPIPTLVKVEPVSSDGHRLKGGSGRRLCDRPDATIAAEPRNMD